MMMIPASKKRHADNLFIHEFQTPLGCAYRTPEPLCTLTFDYDPSREWVLQTDGISCLDRSSPPSQLRTTVGKGSLEHVKIAMTPAISTMATKGKMVYDQRRTGTKINRGEGGVVIFLVLLKIGVGFGDS
ncbi:hypothetical protein CHU98_g10523 [Xylaria longipes]|nr:hypothetical protein CHU98_g10523 [Xylaria longipes]